MNDIDLDTGLITVRKGKGGKQRTVAIGLRALQSLRKYVIYRRSSQSERVFINRCGHPLEVRGIKILVKRLGQKASVKVHAHKLRHTFAVNFLLNGGDVFTLKNILGHSTLKMTLRYLQSLNASDAVKANRKYSPLDNLENKK